MGAYVKLAEAPTLTIRNPECDACCIEVDGDGDGFVCPCCGTSWSYQDGEHTPGTLYEDWSGEDLPGDTVRNDEGHVFGQRHERKKREELFARLGITRV